MRDAVQRKDDSTSDNRIETLELKQRTTARKAHRTFDSTLARASDAKTFLGALFLLENGSGQVSLLTNRLGPSHVAQGQRRA